MFGFIYWYIPDTVGGTNGSLWHAFSFSVETFATIGAEGSTVAREGNIGAPVALDQTTRVVEFNDGIITVSNSRPFAL